jgi:hypothetical protein
MHEPHRRDELGVLDGHSLQILHGAVGHEGTPGHPKAKGGAGRPRDPEPRHRSAHPNGEPSGASTGAAFSNGSGARDALQVAVIHGTRTRESRSSGASCHRFDRDRHVLMTMG